MRHEGVNVPGEIQKNASISIKYGSNKLWVLLIGYLDSVGIDFADPYRCNTVNINHVFIIQYIRRFL